MENQTTYRIKTKLGETEPINIPVSLMQQYNSFEILSLKMNMDENYRSYTSNEGIVVGRVSTANNGLGIPNVRVSIFVPKGLYNQTDEEAVLYPFSSPMDIDENRVRYNLLPSNSDVECYQVVGTFPTKAQILDNQTICEVFEKYYKYTTITNEAGDFMLTNIPVGKQRLHIDADLSDIGPFLSQKPYNMIENLGFEKNRFENTRQFKTSTDLDSLAQIISQNKTIHVYPYWGDATENNAEMKITRTDLSLNYDFKTQAVFIGSVITDQQSNSIRENCTSTDRAGKMSELVTGSGTIEMIRKTIDNKIEQYKIKGDALIDDNGVWCYSIPMNLDYVRTDEYGNIIPTDDPKKGVPTRARVRFRVTLNQMQSDEDTHKRCSYLVPNNPHYDDERFLREKNADYSFGSETWDESFVDLFWNNVYTVKNYIPRIQKSVRPTKRQHSGIKMVNHFGDNNPFPYNSLSIKLNFQYRLLCVIVRVFIDLIYILNVLITTIGFIPCKLYDFKIPIIKVRPFGFLKDAIPYCIELSAEFCNDGINRTVTYPGCGKGISSCVWTERTRPKCESEQYEVTQNGEEGAVCTNDKNNVHNCVENQLAQDNEATSFNFSNDWINGCLYMPLWHRFIRPKKTYFFGLFKREAKDAWCEGEKGISGRDLKVLSFCANGNKQNFTGTDFRGHNQVYNIAGKKDGCGDGCHETLSYYTLSNGLIINRENMFGQKVWYYKSVEARRPNSSIATEYEDLEGNPMVTKVLYATDIVLLGSLNECDTNGTPKLYNYLNSSTYNMPSDLLFTDTEIDYTLDEKGEVVSQNSQQMSIASGCDWGNNNEYGYDDGGLFYDIGCSSISVDIASCINLRRMCELGVGEDQVQYIDNINVNIEKETDKLDYTNLDNYLRPDGYISYDDIVDSNYRSMFATLNANKLKTKINKENGVREYDFRHLYIDNFDGSLYENMKDVQTRRSRANYKYNYRLETPNKDYLLFRMGENPYFYDGKSKISGGNNPGRFTLPKYENSFYFYFGLKEGKTAIDLFNKNYNEKCATKVEEGKENIPFETRGNGWCVNDRDVIDDDKPTYNHKNYDGFLKLNLENIPLPCTIMLNSRDNNGISYTVCKGNNENINVSINDEKICFYGTDSWKSTTTEFDGYEKYQFIYENITIDEDVERPIITDMVNNGEYDIIITDGEGNYHNMLVSIKNAYMDFATNTKSFAQPNNVLLSLYRDDSKESREVYEKIPNVGKVTVNIDNSGFVNILRTDEEKHKDINGTICLYDVTSNDKEIKNILIEIEPSKIKTDEDSYQYEDEDFWKDSENPQETWYSHKMTVIDDKCYECTINNKSGKEYVEIGVETKCLVYYRDKNYTHTSYYIINCPKGDANYRLKITQLCKDEDGLFVTQNSVEQKINVSQPTPYKLYINDIDYDIIKNFKTGWDLKGGERMQWNEKPYSGKSMEKVEGWLDISNIENQCYDWNVDKEKYCSNDSELFKNNGAETLKNIENLKNDVYEAENKIEEEKAKEPLKEKYESEEIWQIEHNKWQEDYDSLEEEYNKCKQYYDEALEIAQPLFNRLDFVVKMKEAFWIQNKEDVKTISFSVATDDTPYDVWSIYTDEMVDSINDDYNENDSECTGESTKYITGIKNPTISSMENADFANDDSGDKDDKGNCFAKANNTLTKKIKTPYWVACVNYQGLTKPEGMKKQFFFGTVNSTNGLAQNKFGNVQDNKGYVMRRINEREIVEFFGFHLIDKILNTDIVCWSYINNIPYYGVGVTDGRLGKTVRTKGIMSGIMHNGITNVGSDVSDFETKTVYDRDIEVKTFEKDSEDRIPTRRCIMGYTDEDENIYKNYRFIEKGEIVWDGEKSQCCTVPNSEGSITISDLNGINHIEKPLYGSMRLRATMLNKHDIKISCVNGDTDNRIKYYMYKINKDLEYPINAFKMTEDGEEISYSLDFGDNMKPWNGENPSQIFHKATTDDVFKKIAEEKGEKDGDITSKEVVINKDGEEEIHGRVGWGNTGEFRANFNGEYFVVASTKDGCRAISPVYEIKEVTFDKIEKKEIDGKYYIEMKITNLNDFYYLQNFEYTVNITFEYKDDNGNTINVYKEKETEKGESTIRIELYKEDYDNFSKWVFDGNVTDVTGLQHFISVQL